MLTVDDIGFLAKDPNELKVNRFGRKSRWLWVEFEGRDNKSLRLNVVTTGDTAVAAGELAEGARIRVRGVLDKRQFGRGEDAKFEVVVEADEVTAEPAAQQAQAKADRKPRS